MSLINGDDNNVWDKAVEGVQLEVQGHVMQLDFHVMHMTIADVVLGHEWLHGLGPSFKRSYQHNTLTFDAHGTHIFLMGEQDVLASPMICNANFHAVINNNEMNSLSLCYLMPPSLDPIVCE